MEFDHLFCFDFQDWLLVALMMKHWNYGVWKQDAVRPPFGVTGAGYCVCMYPGLLTLAYFCLVLMTSLLKVGKSQKVFLFSSHLTSSSSKAPNSWIFFFFLQNLLFVLNGSKWIFVWKSKETKKWGFHRKQILSSLRINKLVFMKKIKGLGV